MKKLPGKTARPKQYQSLKIALHSMSTRDAVFPQRENTRVWFSALTPQRPCQRRVGGLWVGGWGGGVGKSRKIANDKEGGGEKETFCSCGPVGYTYMYPDTYTHYACKYTYTCTHTNKKTHTHTYTITDTNGHRKRETFLNKNESIISFFIFHLS